MRMKSKALAGRGRLELDTPCLALDLDLLDANLRNMQARVRAGNKILRPHAKTHKCSKLARRQIEAGAPGLCAAKVSEAEALVRAGLRNILVTGPVVTSEKIRRLAGCREADPKLAVVLDDFENARALNAAMAGSGQKLDVLVDVDVGLGRTGVPPERAGELARKVMEQPNLRFRGIQAYAGHVQHIRDHARRRAESLACMAPAAEAVRGLRAAGAECEVLSGAGTGTFDCDLEIPELTELQAGSYAVMDAEYMAIGSASNPDRFDEFKPALTLFTTVVSANQAGFVTLDAGLKAVYQHGGRPYPVSGRDSGSTYDWFGDEYGRLTFAAGARQPRVGDVVELVVSHCDPTINLHDEFMVTRNGRVVDAWPIDLRGCCR